MTFTQVLYDVINATRSRLKNPFIGAFIISWVIINWHAIVFFLDYEGQVLDKLKEMDRLFYQGKKSYLIWFPLLSAVLFKVLSPWVFYVIDFAGDKGNDLRLKRQRDREIDSEGHRLKISRMANQSATNEAQTELISSLESQLQREKDANEKLTKDLDIAKRDLRQNNITNSGNQFMGYINGLFKSDVQRVLSETFNLDFNLEGGNMINLLQSYFRLNSNQLEALTDLTESLNVNSKIVTPRLKIFEQYEEFRTLQILNSKRFKINSLMTSKEFIEEYFTEVGTAIVALHILFDNQFAKVIIEDNLRRLNRI